MITVPPNLLAPRLRASRSRTPDQDVESFKFFFVMIFLMVVSIFQNFSNLFGKRKPSIVLSAVIALALDIAALAIYPVHLTYPFLVSVSTALALARMGKSLRPPIVATSILLSGVVILTVDPHKTYSPTLNVQEVSQAVTLQVATCVLIVVTTVQAKQFFVFGKFLAGLLVACTVGIITTTSFLVQKDPFAVSHVGIVVSGLALVLLARRTVRIALRPLSFSPEYASWSLLFTVLLASPLVTGGSTNFDSSDVLVLGLSLIVALLQRFSQAPVVVETKPVRSETDPPVPVLVSSSLTRRKPISQPMATADTTEHTEMADLPQPDKESVSEVSTASSSVVVVAPDRATEMVSANMDLDEDEIFRRIANST